MNQTETGTNTEILDCLENKRAVEVAISTDGDTITCTVGTDPTDERVQAFIETPDEALRDKGIKLSLKSGDLDQYGTSPLRLGDVDHVASDNGKTYYFGGSAWGVPALYLDKPDTLTEFQEGLAGVMQDVVDVWNNAIDSEQSVRERVSQIDDGALMDKIDRMLQIIEDNPVFYTYPGKIKDVDLKAIAENATSKNELQDILKRQVPKPIQESKLFEQIQSVADKLQRKAGLSEVEVDLVDTIQYTRIIFAPFAHTTTTFAVDDVTRRFAIAGITENYLLRNYIGWEDSPYQDHRDSFKELFDNLESQPTKHPLVTEIPEFIKPFVDDQFIWSMAVSTAISNARDIYKLRPNSSKQEIAEIFTHERLHKIIAEAKSTQAKKRRETGRGVFETEDYEESYVDALTQLIAHRGYINRAIEGMFDSETGYKPGALNILFMAQSIEGYYEEPYLGLRILLQGVVDISDGKTLRATSVLRDYYDSITEEGAFENKMKQFADKDVIKYRFDSQEVEMPDTDNTRRHIIEVVQSLTFDDLKPEERALYTRRDQFERERANIIRNPEPGFSLPYNVYSSSPLTRYLMKSISSEPTLKAEMDVFFNAYYRQYVEGVKKIIEEDTQI
ncbi:hypothetical protein GF389_04160 [Candidatus Dojkabacteria bacterium]|nr:hypothetical protein [Candidatus Dojkabacteria bacterium]